MAHAFDEEIVFAVAALRRGEIVAYPTETFYGLGVDALDELALARLRALKGRDGKAISVLVDGPAMLDSVCSVVPPLAAALMRRYWPGALTIALPAQSGLPERARRGRVRRRAPVVASHRAGAGRGPGPAAHDHQREPRRRAARDDRRGGRGDLRGTVPHPARRRDGRAARPARWSGCADRSWRFCGAARSKLIPTRSRVIRVRRRWPKSRLSPDFVMRPTGSAISRGALPAVRRHQRGRAPRAGGAPSRERRAPGAAARHR